MRITLSETIKAISYFQIGKKLSWLLLIIFFNSTLVNAQSAWKLIKEKDGIKIYSRSIEGSSINEIKATFNVKTSMNGLMALLSDVPGFKDWVYRCGEVEELKQTNKYENYYYQRTLVPWPVNDRDLIVYSLWKQDSITKIIQIHGKSMPDFIPEKEGVVRIRYFYNSWKLTPIRNGIVRVDYQISVNPAGIIPAWLANLTITEGPYQTCKSIISEIKKAKYQQAAGLVLEP